MRAYLQGEPYRFSWWECEQKGWLGPVFLELGPDRFCEINLYSRLRLTQELASTMDRGETIFAEPNIVILDELTRGSVVEAMQYLTKIDFFRGANTLRREDIGSTWLVLDDQNPDAGVSDDAPVPR